MSNTRLKKKFSRHVGLAIKTDGFKETGGAGVFTPTIFWIYHKQNLFLYITDCPPYFQTFRRLSALHEVAKRDFSR